MAGQRTERVNGAGSTRLYELVERALRQVQDPCAVALRTNWSVIDLGLLVDVYEGDAGDLVVEMVLTDPLCPYYDRIEQMVCEAVSAQTGYTTVTMEISGKVAWDPGRLRQRPASSQNLPLLPSRFRTGQ